MGNLVSSVRVIKVDENYKDGTNFTYDKAPVYIQAVGGGTISTDFVSHELMPRENRFVNDFYDSHKEMMGNKYEEDQSMEESVVNKPIYVYRDRDDDNFVDFDSGRLHGIYHHVNDNDNAFVIKKGVKMLTMPNKKNSLITYIQTELKNDYSFKQIQKLYSSSDGYVLDAKSDRYSYLLKMSWVIFERFLLRRDVSLVKLDQDDKVEYVCLINETYTIMDVDDLRSESAQSDSSSM